MRPLNHSCAVVRQVRGLDLFIKSEFSPLQLFFVIKVTFVASKAIKKTYFKLPILFTSFNYFDLISS